MYHCGPTVYDFAHIGNLRTAIFNDLVRRLFEYNDYIVTQVMNITDVDDKTIRASREAGTTLESFTQKFEEKYLADISALNILTPHLLPRATESIEAMIEMIATLLKKGVAYKGADGVYMSISKVKDYGALAGLQNISKEMTLSHNHADEYDKENAQDFALWKFKTEADGAVSWKTPFGEGRPGWHIECSAMAKSALGETIDIHTGGSDLIFPHHTNEIAQSESANEKPFAKFWLHAGFVMIGNSKMSKSLGNFVTLREIEAKNISPLSFRYLTLTSHYQSLLNFTWESLAGADTARQKLSTFFLSLPSGGKINSDYQTRFLALINDNLDMPKAIALVWELVKDEKVSPEDKRATLSDFDRVLGLDLSTETELIVPEAVSKLVADREMARISKDFARADTLRAQIKAQGYDVKDTANGPEVISHSK
ncbi:MAG: Cysteine--tRNA ligase [Candidatus Parcubacteria bacterium]